MNLTREQKNALRDIFGERPSGPCAECGGYHLRLVCHRVKRRVLHPNGNTIETEYWQDGKWDASEVVWPEDVFDPDDPEDTDG